MAIYDVLRLYIVSLALRARSIVITMKHVSFPLLICLPLLILATLGSILVQSLTPETKQGARVSTSMPVQQFLVRCGWTDNVHTHQHAECVCPQQSGRLTVNTKQKSNRSNLIRMISRPWYSKKARPLLRPYTSDPQVAGDMGSISITTFRRTARWVKQP